MSNMPPKWMMRFFRWFCRRDLADAVEGDLLELYKRKALSKGRRKANWHFIIYTLSFFQPFAFKRQREQYAQLNGFHMFYNNLKMGFRIIRKYKAYAFINILGLAAGLSAFLLMALFVKDELSYDHFHSKGDRIVRVTQRLESPNAVEESAKVPFPVRQVLVDKYPETEEVARFYHWEGDTPLLAYKNQRHSESGIYFADMNILQVFDFELVRGNRETALSDPRSIVLTERVATRYFGSDDPMGKVMRYKNEDDLVVTGILKNIPDNSHIAFDVLLPIELQRQRWLGWGAYEYDLEKDWNQPVAWVYALLAPGTELGEFETKIQAIAEEHLNDEDQSGFSIQVQPLFDIHLKSDKPGEARANGNMTQVWSFGTIGLLILLIGCVNFINLNAVQMNQRLKEVGLRRAIGARKNQLIAQFLTEALGTAWLASLVAVAIAMATLPVFNEFTNKAMSFHGQNLKLCLGLMGFVLLIAVLSSLRPSMLLVRFKEGQVLTNGSGAARRKQRFSKVMIIGQFMVSNLLIIGILTVNNQLNYLQNKDLGFEKGNMLVLPLAKNLTNNQFQVLNDRLAANPGVAGLNRGYVAGTRSRTRSFKVMDEGNEAIYSLGLKWVGAGFTEMFNLEMVAGRGFDESRQTNLGSGVLMNAAAARLLGWQPEESIGKSLTFLRGRRRDPEHLRVIGVIADAHFENLYEPVVPSIFKRTTSGVGDQVTINIAEKNLGQTLASIEAVWDDISPQWPFEYEFLDKTIEAQYVKEERLASAVKYFTIIAIFIACLGLFGLASFSVQERIKEIGVRKVLGASLMSIFGMVSKRFLWLVAISFLLSTPIGYYLFDQWLQDFAYRIDIGVGVFLMAGLASIVIAVLAVGGQSLRAAMVNPVKTLRYE